MLENGVVMKLVSTSFTEAGVLDPAFAFGKFDPKSRVTLSSNRNPQLSWAEAPIGTKSFAIICHDPDVPSAADDVNQEGREIPSDLPRVDFYHWILIDLAVSMTSIKEGEYSSNVTGKGKRGPSAAHGTRQGVNDFTNWFASDPDMSGDYYGYDGPCPPWNDSIVHHYVFTVYALDVETLPIMGRFNGPDVMKVINQHKLGSASTACQYSLNPRLAK
jgi:Raf kinase inhibitor-like YbhB/YbcL family protein